MFRCKLCDGPLMLLGILGCLKWFRCRNCGMDCHHTVKPRKPRKVVK